MSVESQESKIEFISVNGVKVPLQMYLNGLNRKKRREVLAELRKKNSAYVSLVRADTGAV